MAASSGADAWEITCRDRKDWEFYFIRHKLDQNRLVDVEHIDMKVYKKNRDQTLVGTASAEIAPTASAEEVKQQIADLLYRASLVQNPVFELRSPGENESAAALLASEGSARTNTEENAQEGCSIAGAARDFIEVMKELPETEETYVNSYEIFTKENTVRFINSKGIDVTQKYPASFLEVVLNARDREHEIELYRSYDSGTCDREGLKEDLIRSFRTGIDRLHTQPTPAFESLPVVFATPDAVSIYKYFLDNLSAGQLYMKSSQWKIGEAIGEVVKKIVDCLGLGEYWEAGMDVIDEFMGGVKQKWDEWADWWGSIGERIYDALHGNMEGSYIDEGKVWTPDKPMAVGGIVSRPTRALIGENGAEMVLPLERNTEWMDMLAARIGTGVQIGEINVSVSGAEGIDRVGDIIVQKIDEALRVYQIQQTRGIGGTAWK